MTAGTRQTDQAECNAGACGAVVCLTSTATTGATGFPDTSSIFAHFSAVRQTTVPPPTPSYLEIAARSSRDGRRPRSSCARNAVLPDFRPMAVTVDVQLPTRRPPGRPGRAGRHATPPHLAESRRKQSLSLDHDITARKMENCQPPPTPHLKCPGRVVDNAPHVIIGGVAWECLLRAPAGSLERTARQIYPTHENNDTQQTAQARSE